MPIKKQIAALHLAVGALARSAASLTEELYLERLNGWAARDIVAHLVGWNRLVIEGNRQIQLGELPDWDVDPGGNYSKVNAALVAEYSSTDRSELLDELWSSARELEGYLLSLEREVWGRDFGVRHAGTVVTIQLTVDELIADYAHHTHQIEEWAAGRRESG